ncbi:MAG: ribbon-helix-helix domain-containing protein [Rhodospirillaceae bacterium]|nr:ribbon-helix-helix domain-containing protein [Rhodospirillaceae bacterium]
MRSTKQLSITLPTKMAKAVRDKVANGGYASESEVVRDGLRTLLERDAVVEEWLRSEVIPTIKRHERKPARFLDSKEVRANLKALRDARAK